MPLFLDKLDQAGKITLVKGNEVTMMIKKSWQRFQKLL